MGKSIDYHLKELEIVRSRTDPRRSLPELEVGEKKVLDVGCGIGQTLLAEEMSSAEIRCGVDVDCDAIAYGRSQFPFLDLRVAPAESLPFPDNSFDLVFARVALPYTNLPLSLNEMHRVLRPDGRFWAVFHPWRIERNRLFGAVKGMSLRSIFDSAYVCINSVCQHGAGVSIGRPWSGLHESFQTVRGVRRMLLKSGFRILPGEIDLSRAVICRK